LPSELEGRDYRIRRAKLIAASDANLVKGTGKVRQQCGKGHPGVATDGKGNSFLTGSFTGRVEFDGTAQASDGAAADIFVVKYDRAGAQRWFVRAGSDRTDHAYTIVSDGKGSLYLSGACSGPAKFGTHTVPHRGSNDIFLAKLVEKAPATKKE